MSKKADIETTAEAYLELLAARGVEYFFGNAGTDFAPIIEAYARRGAHGQLLPRPITVPHEVPAERHDSFEYADPSRAPRPSDVVAAGEAVEEAARIIATAKNPVVIAKALGRDPRAVEAMVKLAEVAALPVVDHFHTHVNFPQDHPLHAGFEDRKSTRLN